jgi:hypothetical protein
MARLDVLKPSQVADAEVRAMLEASGDEMYGVYGHCPELFTTRPLPMSPNSHAVLREG